MTYKKVQDEYKRKHNRTVKTCWIADIKRKHNKTSRIAYNRGEGAVKYPCPQNIYLKLEKVMKECGMI